MDVLNDVDRVLQAAKCVPSKRREDADVLRGG